MTEYKKILKRAKQIKNNSETKQKLNLPAQWSYFFAESILNNGKDVKSKKGIGKAPKPHGDRINIVIPKKDYLKLAHLLIKFVDEKGRIPNFLTYKNKRIRTRLYTYKFACAVVYYHNHKKLPSEMRFNYRTFYKTKPKTYKKYGHSTISGCDNRGQNTPYFCGCHSLQEVFRNLTDIVVPQSTIAAWAGTTVDGTDHEGLNTAVAQFNRKYKKNLKVEWKNFSDLGWNGIRKIINSNNQDCVIHNLYRYNPGVHDGWGHYEVINKVHDDYCDVQNSLGDYCSNGCYCGYVEERTLSEFRTYISGISQKSVMVITNVG